MRHQRVGDTGTDQGKGQRGGSRGRVSNILTDSRRRARWPLGKPTVGLAPAEA